MRHLRPAGRGASALKYDLLTAMGAFALAAAPSEQKRVLRLMTLITARYNWASDSLAVGQREIAQLWSCTDRTVKRDMSVLRGRGWLVLRRQGARGRVSEYGLDLDRILADTRDVWDAVGPDFAVRLGGGLEESTNIVPLQVKGTAPMPDGDDASEWGLARHALRAQDAGTYAAWIHALKRDGRAGGCLVLKAPSRFHASYVQTHLVGRLLAACRDVDPAVDAIDLRA
jgi:hypothetical protein